jgi:mannan endo-1,4-beta-mannosidase
MVKYIGIILFTACILWGCNKGPESPLIDKKASKQTIALYNNLMRVQKEGKILFGHQDATSYGRTWYGDEDRSDIKDITGSHPAVIGLDFANATETDQTIFNREKKRLANSVKNTHKRGGITTFAWHATNPANHGSFYWDQNPVKIVSDILPGERYHITYKKYLQSIAIVASEFRDDNGELIPVIFRPFHEYDGEWFWWGKGHCTKEEFLILWRFTVDYLRNTLGVHNFIYAFSPDCRFTTEEEYLDYYPGDDYVDMLGMDDYWDFRPDGANDPQLAEMKLNIVSDLAARKNKLAAFTETGLEGITQPDWFTATLLPILEKVNICYVLVWRNAHDMEHHYYAPDKGHPAEEDFIKFCEDERILMEKNLENMYE